MNCLSISLNKAYLWLSTDLSTLSHMSFCCHRDMMSLTPQLMISGNRQAGGHVEQYTARAADWGCFAPGNHDLFVLGSMQSCLLQG